MQHEGAPAEYSTAGASTIGIGFAVWYGMIVSEPYGDKVTTHSDRYNKQGLRLKHPRNRDAGLKTSALLPERPPGPNRERNMV